jgi:hypothetical protein
MRENKNINTLQIRKHHQEEKMAQHSVKTKRDMDGEENNKNESSKCNDVNAVFVQSSIDDMKEQFKQRIQPLKDDASYAINKCQQIHAANMVKIPRNVKNMTIGEFDAVYHCDLLQLIKDIRKDNSQIHQPLADKTSRHQQLVSETPDVGSRSGRRLQTPSRTVRKGREYVQILLDLVCQKKLRRISFMTS